jgi:ABC-type sugar transport system permease subunit
MRRLVAVGAVVVVILIAAGVRVAAVDRQKIDYDEDDYMRAGQLYAAAIRSGDWAAFTQTNYRPEHPPLAKIAFGIVLAALPPAPLVPEAPTTADPAKSLPEPQLAAARLTAATFGVLEVAALALVDPLGGLFLAVHTWTVKYTSQVMLEALPALLSVLTVLAYLAWKRRWLSLRAPPASLDAIGAVPGVAAAASSVDAAGALPDSVAAEAAAPVAVPERAARRLPAVPLTTWLVLSAVFLGLTAAGKYLYVAAGVAVLIDMVWVRWRAGDGMPRPRRAWAAAAAPLGWGLLAVAVFVAASPYLWPDPVGRVLDSLLYFQHYANTAPEVASAGFPMWMPFVWLMTNDLANGVYVVTLDVFITLLAIVGIGRLWRRERTWVLWLAVALVFLILWPTKWPQYILVLTAPLSLAAAQGFRVVVLEPARRAIGRLRVGEVRRPRMDRRSLRDLRGAAPWLLPGLLVLGVILLFPLIYQAAMSLTDFTSLSIRDGIRGGVWREVAGGLTGQVPAIDYQPFGTQAGSTRVQFAGFSLLWDVFRGGVADLLVFTLLWTISSVALQAILGIGVALLVARRGIRFRGLWRTIYILPWAIPEFIGALVWFRIWEPTNGWIALFFGTDIGWQDRPETALAVQLMAATWIGWPLVFLAATAGLALVPPEMLEAARIDGAGAWRTFRSVLFPLLVPLVVPALIVRALLAFNQFYLFYVLQGPNSTAAAASFFVFSPTAGGLFAVSAALNVFAVVVLTVCLGWFVQRQRAGEVTYV